MAGSNGKPAGHRKGRRSKELNTDQPVLSTAEAAALLGVERPRIGRWIERGIMPKMYADLTAGPIWRRTDIIRFRDRRAKELAARTEAATK